MKKEKYYTPEETEFSIGFEYEERYGEKWYKREYLIHSWNPVGKVNIYNAIQDFNKINEENK